MSTYSLEEVADSEPERAALRIRKQSLRGTGTNVSDFAGASSTHKNKLTEGQEIMYLGYSHGPISGSQTSLDDEPHSISSNDNSFKNICQHEIGKQKAVLPSYPTSREDSSGCFLKDSLLPNDADEVKTTLNLANFAYNDVGTSVPPPPRVKALATENPSSYSRLTPKKKRNTKPFRLFLAGLSDNDLAKVRKCVSCDVKWTTRKSPSQKILHMQSCAKKRMMNEETVCILIRKDIGVLFDSAASQARPQQLDPSHEAVTLYEHCVSEDLPKQSWKRKMPITTIADATANRDDILHRAQAVLISSDQDVHMTGSNFMQTLSPPSIAHPSATKPLLPLFTDRPTAPVESSEDFPATQVFAPSKLVGLKAKSRPLYYPGKSPEIGSLTRDSLDDEYQSLYVSSSNSLDTEPRHNELEDVRVLEVKSSHFEIRYVSSSPEHVQVTLPAVLLDQSADKNDAEKANASIVSPLKSPSSCEGWQNLLKKKIMQDDKLYIRILHFEPIHFNVFLELAMSYSEFSTARKTRELLRSFLDEHAINFYGETDALEERKYRR